MSTNFTDPFIVWKNFYEALEPKVTEPFQQLLGSEAYAALSAQLLSASLHIERQFLKSIESLQQVYKVPSLKDVERIGEIIIGLESKIDSIDERLLHFEQALIKSNQIHDDNVTQENSQKPIDNEPDSNN